MENLFTFAFLVGELVVRQAKPPLLEVLHSEPFPSLGPLNHEAVREGARHLTECPQVGTELPPGAPHNHPPSSRWAVALKPRLSLYFLVLGLRVQALGFLSSFVFY